jgi:hypothetical protein
MAASTVSSDGGRVLGITTCLRRLHKKRKDVRKIWRKKIWRKG